MTAMSVNAGSIKPYLLNRCGYGTDLVQDDFHYSGDQTVKLAAFSHLPLDARSACIAAIDCETDDPKAEVLQQRELGAPLVFASFRDRLQLWKPGPNDAECLEAGLTAGQLNGFFAEHEADFAPSRIYEAKTLGRIPGSGRQLDRFVDIRLLPFVEQLIGSKLTDAVTAAVAELKGAFGSQELDEARQEWILKSTFRLLAAKILKDKRVYGFITLDLRNLDDVFQRVQKHYGSKEKVLLGGPRRREALTKAAEVFSGFGNLRNLTTETLADVYEEALITEETRKLRGTHGTPSYLVDYIVWQLAPWIKKIDPRDLYVFEPACGHAPFLVGMVRLLRSIDLGLDAPALSTFLRERLGGIEIDSFALEIARLSLTVADVPNPNGWDGLKSGNMFTSKILEEETKRCRVLLMNPPFEDTKPLRVLQRTIPHLPAGAVFGVVAPAAMLYSPKNQVHSLRKWLIENCQLSEVSLFPDEVFRFADQEIAIILGRRHFGRTDQSATSRLRRVREEDTGRFKEDYSVTTDRVVPQSRIADQDKSILWVPELEEEIWSWLGDYPRLGTIAQVGQGFTHKKLASLPPGTITVAEREFPGSVIGFVGTRGNPHIHRVPSQQAHLNLDPETVSRKRTGLEVGVGQVLLNYAPANRMIWKIRAFIDRVGRPAKGQLVTVRPAVQDLTLEYLWALCISPIANAYIHTHSLKRHIEVGTLREMPVPRAEPSDVRRITRAALNYIDAAKRFDVFAKQGGASVLPLFDGSSSEVTDERTLHSLLKQLDAEVLQLYDLPARAERKLLDLFAGRERPGVPGRFRGYYPKGFSQAIPLYAYLSDSYQEALRGGQPDLPQVILDRYDELIGRQLSDELSEQEKEELHRLQAEVDGRDYAAQAPDTTWLESIEEAQREARVTLGEIAGKLVDLSRDGLSRDENPAP
jgi:hypothetical protein